MNAPVETWASEIKLRAQRRIGEISRELEKVKTIGGGKVGIPTDGKPKSQVLKEAGLSTSTAHRCEETWMESEIKLGKLLKEMPKNKGTKGQLKGKTSSGSTKMEPPEQEQPATYTELGINRKDASKWQRNYILTFPLNRDTF